MIIRKQFFYLLTPLFLLGCKKDSGGGGTPEPDVPGTITITTPTTGTIYDNGFVLRVEGDMTDNNVLSKARVEIRNKATSAIIYQQTMNTGNVTFFHFNWPWTVTGITAPFTATVKVVATDKLSNQVFKEVDVTLTN